MKRIKLGIHGGGRLEVHGSLAAKRILILVSRERFQLDDALMARLIGFFAGHDYTVVRYESQVAVTTRLIDRKCFQHLPLPLRQGLKALLLFFLPAHWRLFSRRHRAKINAIAYRVRALRELIQFLGPGKEIIFLTRSAGGRVASLIADETGVKKLVCMGYPFQPPEDRPDTERYAHLKNLRTPFLILQGTRDSYGGRESAGKYPLAPNTMIQWVETDHHFEISEEEWDRVLGLINDFILCDDPAARRASLIR